MSYNPRLGKPLVFGCGPLKKLSKPKLRSHVYTALPLWISKGRVTTIKPYGLPAFRFVCSYLKYKSRLGQM